MQTAARVYLVLIIPGGRDVGRHTGSMCPQRVTEAVNSKLMRDFSFPRSPMCFIMSNTTLSLLPSDHEHPL